MYKKYCFIFAQLIVFFLLLDYLTLGTSDNFGNGDGRSLRQKRNLLCLFGLTDFIQETFYESLGDIRKKDPLELGDSTDGKLRDGIFRGLSSLTNVSSIDVQCHDDKVVLTTTLGMKDAEIYYKWFRKYLLKLSGSIWTKAKEVHFRLEVTLDMAEAVDLKVTNTLVTKLDGFKFGFTGLGPLNPIVKGFVKGMHKIWSTKITKKIEKLIRISLEKQFDKLTNLAF